MGCKFVDCHMVSSILQNPWANMIWELCHHFYTTSHLDFDPVLGDGLVMQAVGIQRDS